MVEVKVQGVAIPAIGLGTWTLKGRDCSSLVEAALAAGYRHVDTAANYGNEGDVGAGLRAAGLPRDDIFVTTKVWWTNLGADDLRRSAENSLSQLRLDAVDLLLIHWPNPAIPLAETIAALNRVLAEGLARNIGVSNFPTGPLCQAVGLSEAPLICNQVERHPYLDQGKVHAACLANDMAMIAYSPLHRGGDLFREGAVVAAAKAHGRTPAQIVLRWNVQHRDVVVIPRTSRAERLAENAAIFDFALTSAEMEAISALNDRNARLCDFAFSPKWDD